ncbi:MAG: flagellin lysine-N-methylase [Lachnospiraceae bacterium]|nr:flagellin lysine-N-methylase [Lachnospiraceae bacterium]
MYQDSIYDSFQCIAEQCTMTCCKGWAIRVEQESYDNWQNHEETKYLCEYTTHGGQDDEKGYQMKQNPCQACVLLDENGLCEIVKRHGEHALSETCARFPRKQNEIDVIGKDEADSILVKEYSLSGACPSVLELIHQKPEQCRMQLPPHCLEHSDFPMEYQVRNALIGLLWRREFSLEDRLMLCFSLLHECLECEWEEEVYACIEVYEDAENLQENLKLWQKTIFDEKEALIEVCQTLFDVTQFYKEEPAYQPYLHDIAAFVEELDGKEAVWNELLQEWHEWNGHFAKDMIFYENVLVSEIYGDCVSDDLEYLTEHFQSIAMEFIMTRVSVFIKEKLAGRKLRWEEVRDYLSLYIRMIGHNTDGMAEYWEENFEDPVLEMEYFFLILH